MKKWFTLNSTEQKIVISVLVADAIGKAAAWHFLYHLPAQKIMGSKWLWLPVTFIGGLGAPAFLAFGIKK
ncbi:MULTISPECIES: hypothetical protein [Corynebacterium]|uniref:Cardiolipin synthase N-terminal domain-containing protein n=1 Tax=Corynebacterium ramonii TaxID=3026968 RepID=A0ABM5RT16_9CORY|nr:MULTISPECIES: hypothetical protein [Corynebacterium]AIU32741.1 Hypothetical protein CulFRC11_1165 [Corynebacterium ramonii FRC0011]ESU58147.1 hypothetical protein D881_06990 [Corynebacterium ulcerans NCTC 12077]ESU58272.1 hypothetical protein D881_06930 [Corynebacterium ulcerans NCTC 12077]STC74726.1 Uncharacterised protein [Corynebacterium ulcerans]